MTFGERLKSFREARKLTQEELAARVGVAKSTVTGYEKGHRTPDMEKTKKIAASLGITANDLLGTVPQKEDSFTLTTAERQHIEKYRTLDDHGKMMVDFALSEESARMRRANLAAVEPETEELFLYHIPVSAGTGTVLDDWDGFDKVKVLSNVYTRRADFLLTVSGSSMLPRFQSGDIILVQEAEDVEFGEVGIWYLDGRSYVKQKGHDRLISLNSDYRDVYPDEFNDCRCQGRVVGILDPDWMVSTK